MEKTNKTVMQESAKVLSEKIDIPDGPNVAPSPFEHLAAQGDLTAAQPVPDAVGSGATPSTTAGTTDKASTVETHESTETGRPLAD